MSIGKAEYKTQEKVIKFFKNKNILDYAYIGNLKDKSNKNIIAERLEAFLKGQGYSETVARRAIDEIVRTAGDTQHDIYNVNKNVYELLKYGVKVRPNADSAPVTVYLIDFENPTNNDFAIAEEVTIIEKQEKRPDIVIYLNGIAVSVIEL